MKHSTRIPSSHLSNWRQALACLISAFALVGGAPEDWLRAPHGLAAMVRKLERHVRGLVLALALEVSSRARKAPSPAAASAAPPQGASGEALPGFCLFEHRRFAAPPDCAAALEALNHRDQRRSTSRHWIRRLLALEAVFINPWRAARRLARQLNQRRCLIHHPGLVLPPFDLGAPQLRGVAAKPGAAWDTS